MNSEMSDPAYKLHLVTVSSKWLSVWYAGADKFHEDTVGMCAPFVDISSHNIALTIRKAT